MTIERLLGWVVRSEGRPSALKVPYSWRARMWAEANGELAAYVEARERR